MQKTNFRFAVLFLLLIVSAAQAQYLVSSKAGFVNRVEGKVTLKLQGGSPEDLNQASLGSQMKDGDRITTEANSHAELLLAPGSYLRLNEKTELEAVNTSLDNTRFDVVQGSIILEVGEIDKKVPFEIGTPRAVVTINKIGIYRLDVVGKDVAVSVRKGEAYIGTRDQLMARSAIKVSGNKVYRLIGDVQPQTAKLSTKVFDAFDQWSYLRAETLVTANYSTLQRTRSRNTLLSGWVYDPVRNTYTYIPNSWLYVSPYQFAFYRRYSDCDWCWGGYYNSPYYGGYYGGGYPTGGGNTTNPGSGSNVPARVTDDSRTASRGQSQREVQSRQVEPYSRPTVFYPTERSSRYDSPSVFDSSRSSSGSYSGSFPSSSPASSVPSRVETSAPSSSGGADRGSGGRSDTSRGSTGPRGN